MMIEIIKGILVFAAFAGIVFFGWILIEDWLIRKDYAELVEARRRYREAEREEENCDD